MWIKILKNIWRISLWLISAILIFTNGYILAGTFLGRIPVNQDFKQASPETGVQIFVISNGVHTDILLPTQTPLRDWRDDFPPETFKPNPAVAQPEYIGFGWGEKRLYEDVPAWGDLTLPIFLSAMAIPSESSMHVTYWSRPLQVNESVKKIFISEEQHQIIIDQVLSALERDQSGRVISQDCCWYPWVSDNFYQSPPSYHLFRTCNHWTTNTLRAAGLPAPLWSPFAEDALKHLPSAPTE